MRRQRQTRVVRASACVVDSHLASLDDTGDGGLGGRTSGGVRSERRLRDVIDHVRRAELGCLPTTVPIENSVQDELLLGQ